VIINANQNVKNHTLLGFSFSALNIVRAITPTMVAIINPTINDIIKLIKIGGNKCPPCTSV